MSVRLVVSIVFLFLAVAFVGFNLDNACDISFGFAVLPAVPVFLTILASFASGMAVSLIFSLRRGVRGSGKIGTGSGTKNAAAKAKLKDYEESAYGID